MGEEIKRENLTQAKCTYNTLVHVYRSLNHNFPADFQTAYKMTSQPSILTWTMDKKPKPLLLCWEQRIWWSCVSSLPKTPEIVNVNWQAQLA